MEFVELEERDFFFFLNKMSMMFDFVLFSSFIYSFEERLAAQRKEREMATAELGFKKQLTKEGKFEKRKQRLAAIGNVVTYQQT